MAEPSFDRWVLLTKDVDVYTWTFWQAGTTEAQVAANDTSKRLNLTGLVFRLSIEWEGGSLLLVSGTDAQFTLGDQSVLDQRGQVTAALTASQRASLPVNGRTIKFNLQAVDGSLKDTWIIGEIVAVEWVQNA